MKTEEVLQVKLSIPRALLKRKPTQEGEAPKCLNLVADYARTKEGVLLEHLLSCASDGPAVMVGRLKGYGVQIKMRSARLRL